METKALRCQIEEIMGQEPSAELELEGAAGLAALPSRRQYLVTQCGLSRQSLALQRMLFRVFWPGPESQAGVLLGWWLTEEGSISKEDADVQAAFVACVVPTSLPDAEAKLRALAAEGEEQATRLTILGEAAEAAEAAEAETKDQRMPWIRCQRGRMMRVSEVWAKNPATSIQVLFYSSPARRGPLAAAVLGVRPLWIEALVASPALPTQLEAVLPLLDISPQLLDSLQAAEHSHVREAWVLCCGASACDFFGHLSGRVLSYLSNADCLHRSALFSQLRIRLELQSKWSFQNRELAAALLCSVLLDIFLGVALVLWLRHSVHSASHSSSDLLFVPLSLHRWAYEKRLESLVGWLMGAPADFKLNRELTSFAGDLFLSMFSLWGRFALSVSMVPTAAAEILHGCLLFAGLSGVSLWLACIMDLLAMASLPLFIAYLGTCLCWKMATHSLYTLSLLFQGRKHNVLRSRIDHHHFDVNQLLIGVILLSIVVFLLPSLFMFYSCFMAMWLLVLAAHYAFGLLVSLCNHQAFFLVSLRPSVHIMLELLEDQDLEDEHLDLRALRLTLRPGSTGFAKALRGFGTSLGHCGPGAFLLAALSGEPLPLCRLRSPALPTGRGKPDGSDRLHLELCGAGKEQGSKKSSLAVTCV